MKKSKRINSLMVLVICMALLVTTIIVPQNTATAATDFSTAKTAAYNWLVAQQVTSGNAFVGLVDSFEDYWADGTKVTKEYTYDQAVAAIAFLLYGDTARATQVLDMLAATQDSTGFWLNSYWWNNGYGEELRKHVGPVMWVCLAVMNYEKITGDTTTYHNMATKAIDWCLTFQKSNGAISGGQTTWDVAGTWTDEVWSSTEQNEDAYAALVYFASTTPAKAATYTTAATNVKSFLDNVVWDSTHNRWYGGFKNNTGLIDPFVPMDVNPWGVLALGLSGTRNYQSSINYVENANGNPGTLANPRYSQNLAYSTTTINAYDFDWESDGLAGSASSGGGVLGPDIWFEGSAFMSCAYSMMGNETKSDAILTELIKKQGKDGSMAGGIPYCLNGTNNNYWRMAQQNCVSSTGWFIIAAAKWNPFKGVSTQSTTPTVATPTFSPAGGTYTGAQSVTLSCSTAGATIRYTTNGSTPTTSSTAYTTPINVSATTTIKAMATATGYNNSAVATAAYTIGNSPTVATPTFSPVGGTYTGTQSVTLSCSTAGATIRYTTNGSTPTTSSTAYTTPINVSATTTIKAMATATGYNNSSVATSTYTIGTVGDYSQGATALNTTQAQIWFKSNLNANWVDVHYKLNSGAQLNYRMTYNSTTGNWEQTISNLAANTVISYSFTYEKNGLANDTGWFNYTFAGGGTSNGTTWYLFNTAVSGVTPAGQTLQTANSGVTGWQPIKTINTTASYWYAPAATKTYVAGNWTFTLWTNSPASSSSIKVDLYKVNTNGSSAVLIGSQTKDIFTTGIGNHASTYTFTTTAGTALSNQRLMVKITKTAGVNATMAYNTNDFPTRLVTP